MLRIKLSSIQYILIYATNKEKIDKYCTEPDNSEIKNCEDCLKRVWNDGKGLLELASFASNGTLLLNTMLLSQAEQIQLKFELDDLNIKTKFIYLGYPEFFEESLNSLYQYLK